MHITNSVSRLINTSCDELEMGHLTGHDPRVRRRTHLRSQRKMNQGLDESPMASGIPDLVSRRTGRLPANIRVKSRTLRRCSQTPDPNSSALAGNPPGSRNLYISFEPHYIQTGVGVVDLRIVCDALPPEKTRRGVQS